MYHIFCIQFKERKCPRCKSIADLCKKVNDSLLFDSIRDISGEVDLSNVFPKLEEEFFVEKPSIINDNLLNLSLADFKYHRFMKYLPLKNLGRFLEGTFDFEKNGKISFGAYVKEEGEWFEMNPALNLYFLFHTKDFISPDQLKVLRETTERIVEDILSLPVFVACEQAGVEWELWLGKGGNSKVMTLGDFHTGKYTKEELEELLEGAQYTPCYDKESRSIVLRPGALFQNSTEILNGIIYLELKE